jgi:hypothetical protein
LNAKIGGKLGENDEENVTIIGKKRSQSIIHRGNRLLPMHSTDVLAPKTGVKS